MVSYRFISFMSITSRFIILYVLYICPTCTVIQSSLYIKYIEFTSSQVQYDINVTSSHT